MEGVASDHAPDEVESEGKLPHGRDLVGLAVHFQLSQHSALALLHGRDQHAAAVRGLLRGAAHILAVHMLTPRRPRFPRRRLRLFQAAFRAALLAFREAFRAGFLSAFRASPVALDESVSASSCGTCPLSCGSACALCCETHCTIASSSVSGGTVARMLWNVVIEGGVYLRRG